VVGGERLRRRIVGQVDKSRSAQSPGSLGEPGEQIYPLNGEWLSKLEIEELNSSWRG